MGNRDNSRPLRTIWQATIRQHNGWTCRRCGKIIKPGEPFDLGHRDDANPNAAHLTHGIEPEHPFCNRSAGAKARNTLHRLRPSRDW